MRKILSITISLILFFSAEAKDVRHPGVCNEEYVELMEIVARLAGNSIFTEDYAPIYQADVDSIFSSFKEHPAVKWLSAHEKTEPWICYDAIPWFGAHLKLTSGKFELIPNCDRSYKRWPRRYSREFLPLLTDFYNTSSFHQFYVDHTEMYENAVSTFRTNVADYIDLDWFDSFFGAQAKHKAVTWSANRIFNIIVALNNGGGNFGIQRQKPGQEHEVISVMLYAEKSDGLPHYDVNGEEVLLLVHEFCHSYLSSPAKWKKTGKQLLNENREKMQSVGYGIWQNIIEETLVRASVIRYMIDHDYPREAIRNQIDSEHEFYGFNWLPNDIDWYTGDILSIFDVSR